MVKFGMFPLHPFLPRLHWVGMDTRNAGIRGGTVWDAPTLSLPSYGTLVVQFGMFPFCPWYSGVHDGMGWDGMHSRYSEQDHLGYSHFNLMDMTKGTHRMGYPSTVGRL